MGSRKKKRKKEKEKNSIIPLISFIVIIAIIVIIIICLIAIIKNKKLQKPELLNVVKETKQEDITTVESIELIYGMDGCNVIEIPITKETSEVTAISNDESVAIVLIEKDKLKIEAVCDEVNETTVDLEYNDIRRSIPVNVKPSCLVEFNTDGGTSVIPQMIIYEGQVIRPENPTKEGYEFAGWYIDEELTEEYNFDSSVESDMTIYAKFQ